jgi:hypothetical protein
MTSLLCGTSRTNMSWDLMFVQQHDAHRVRGANYAHASSVDLTANPIGLACVSGVGWIECGIHLGAGSLQRAARGGGD